MNIPRFCSLGCGKRVTARGWCNAHYQRWRVYGDPSGGGPPYLRGLPDLDRLLLRTAPGPTIYSHLGPCTMFIGSKNGDGYGTFNLAGRIIGAHRAAWLLQIGSILGDHEVTHLCDNRACVRLDHLRLGTHADNMGDMSARNRTMHGSKMVCVNGHLLDETNTYIRPSGGRRCRQCDRARNTEARDRRKAYHREYRKQHRDEIRAYMREHSDKLNAQARARYHAKKQAS